MAVQPQSYRAFHGTESFQSVPRPIGKLESVGNVLRALWAHRKDFSADGPVAAAKSIIPDLPLNDPIGKFMSNEVMHMLYGSMLHPPSSYRGNEFQYRSADGSNNSMLYPNLGKAGLAYAKSVQTEQPANGAKPDVGDIFDLLMARDGKGQESKLGISSMLLYNATIIIHDVFRTNDDNRNISDTSSYLDLSPLYGKDAEVQKTVRLGKDGLLKPDTFAEHRLLNQPPGVSIFLIMYNRFHNYAAKQLLAINENGKFDKPLDFDNLCEGEQKAALEKLDEDLFQTARLITCGLFIQIAIHDYLRCLMMMHAKDTSWTLNPRAEYNGFLDKGVVSRGQGNMVSVEFNVLYRFHSPLSTRDAEWSADLFELFMSGEKDENGKPKYPRERIDSGDIPIREMGQKLKEFNKVYEKDATERLKLRYFPEGFDRVTQPGQYAFKRDKEGYFDDAQMVAELVRVMEDPICSFGARQIPKVFKSIEMMGLLQSRKWEVCTLNEFRKFFNMETHKRFEDINTDTDICDKLRDLYGDVDKVELYPGYLCEGQGRNVDPGTSCPNNQSTALWRGIFSDAVTLVRSDRFYTTEWNVNAITSWGMQEVTSDPTINKGGLLYKLCHRAFPGYFKYNSLHLWQPFYTAARNLVLAKEQGKLKDLDIDGLEFQFPGDKKWRSLKTDAEGEVPEQFFKELSKLDPEDQNRLRVRRKLEQIKLKRDNKEYTPPPSWRGFERATKVAATNVSIGSYEGTRKPDFGDYTTIKDKILGGKTADDWTRQSIAAFSDIPRGPLREIMTNNYESKRWNKAMKIIGESLNAKDGKLNVNLFREYFSSVANQIREREERPLGKYQGDQVYQLDVVSDYAIPAVTCFFADWLGFWDRVKTVEFPNREFSENAVYQLLDNCQDYQSWDSDQTKGMKRRQLFQASIQKLKTLADYGVLKSSSGFLCWRDLFRSYGSGKERKDSPATIALREASVRSTQALLRKGFGIDEAASIMLCFALDSVHKLILNFTEILAYFIDPTTHTHCTVGDKKSDYRTKLWAEIQQLALKNDAKSDELIAKYALEAQRLSPSNKLARRYAGKDPVTIRTQVAGNVQDITIQKGQLVLLDLHAANQNGLVFNSPSEFRTDRKLDTYLIYGHSVNKHGIKETAHFSKQLGLTYLTALLKHTSTMKQARVAHDKLGRLKRVKAPGGLPGYPAQDVLNRYMSAQWDVLLPFPVTWEIRYNGMYNGKGQGVWEDGDNANQGHGQNQVYQKGQPVWTGPQAMAPAAPTYENVTSKDITPLKAPTVSISEIPGPDFPVAHAH